MSQRGHGAQAALLTVVSTYCRRVSFGPGRPSRTSCRTAAPARALRAACTAGPCGAPRPTSSTRTQTRSRVPGATRGGPNGASANRFCRESRERPQSCCRVGPRGAGGWKAPLRRAPGPPPLLPASALGYRPALRGPRGAVLDRPHHLGLCRHALPLVRLPEHPLHAGVRGAVCRRSGGGRGRGPGGGIGWHGALNKAGTERTGILPQDARAGEASVLCCWSELFGGAWSRSTTSGRRWRSCWHSSTGSSTCR
jgi:hypothetical protein